MDRKYFLFFGGGEQDPVIEALEKVLGKVTAFGLFVLIKILRTCGYLTKE